MRFCMVTTFYPPYHYGGDATYVRSLSKALVRLGHEVDVIHCIDSYALREGYDKHFEAAQSTTDDGIVVHRLQSPLRFLSPLITQQTGHPGLKHRALQSLLNQDFDVIHFHNISLIGGPAVLKMGSAPVKLYTLHEYWLLCPTHVFWKNDQKPCDKRECMRCCVKSGVPPQWWRYTSLSHECADHVDALLAPSEYTAKRHFEAGFTAPIHVLPLFSTLHSNHPFFAPVNQYSGQTGDRPLFLFVGRVTAAKGIVPLLENFAQLPQYDLTVVGDGALRLALEKTYKEYSNIRFLGEIPQQQLIPLYQNATALIVPSLMMETFNLTTVEAFSCGTPVIARSAGGNVNLIEKTGGGIIYDSDDQLRRALKLLTENSQHRQQLGALAYEGYLSYYTEEIHLNTYLAEIRFIQLSKGIGKVGPEGSPNLERVPICCDAKPSHAE